MGVARFAIDCLRLALGGSRLYRALALALLVVAVVGLRAYLVQLDQGLVVTGMSDHVSWGAYIANFTYVVGLAAGAVMLVIPAYIFHEAHAKQLVLIAEGIAVAACTMAVLFVFVDLGRPDRILFLVPLLGSLNLPSSLLAWDVLVISGYLGLNLAIPAVVLYQRHRGHVVRERVLFPWIVLSIFWAIALHMVTAFLFSASVARPFWHTALLGPRFLATAFCSGPAFLILVLWALRRWGRLDVAEGVIRMLAVIVTVALQVNLVMLVAEVFTEFYTPTDHSRSAMYLFVGLGEHDALVPWIRAAIGMEIVAVVVLMIRPFRERTLPLLGACILTAVGVWIEKGMGLIVPGFVPSPLGEVVEYAPTAIEVQICAGIWAIGLLVFLVLAKVAIGIERGDTPLATRPA